MQRNVFSFKVAIAKGCEPRLYSYDPGKMPLGVFDARLDCKIWSKRIIAINCYFIRIDTEERFVVTVYCNRETSRFQLSHSTVDFSQCPTGEIYCLKFIKNDKGKVLLEKAEPAQHVTQ
ncbi:MAG TPA: hypothetical protein VEY06_14950 [Flavisolibacter sp.]|jgi:hypothetical protein|nr:hypothetical protein [Flavisolibacter sp.]